MTKEPKSYYKKKKDSRSELMKYTAKYWSSLAKPENRSLNLKGTINPMDDPSINKIEARLF